MIYPQCKSSRAAIVLNMLGILALVSGAATLRPAIVNLKQAQSATQISDEDREQANMSPFAQILGEIRGTAADLMWVKTERYLHKGVAFAPHMDSDALARSGEIVDQARPVARRDDHDHDAEHDHAHDHDHGHADEQGHEHDHDHEHAKEVALIPEANSDYRGFIGALHREIQPWQGPDQPHVHEAGNELLPWYRLLTISNPQHWRGYVIGSWWLLQEAQQDPRALDEAAEFIAEGLRNNPNILQVPLMQCRILLAREEYEQALAAARLAIRVGYKYRPRDGKPNTTTWTDSDEEDFRAAVRYVPMLEYRKLQRIDAAREALRRAIALVPDDVPLRNMMAEIDRADPIN